MATGPGSLSQCKGSRRRFFAARLGIDENDIPGEGVKERETLTDDVRQLEDTVQEAILDFSDSLLGNPAANSSTFFAPQFHPTPRSASIDAPGAQHLSNLTQHEGSTPGWLPAAGTDASSQGILGEEWHDAFNHEGSMEPPLATLVHRPVKAEAQRLYSDAGNSFSSAPDLQQKMENKASRRESVGSKLSAEHESGRHPNSSAAPQQHLTDADGPARGSFPANIIPSAEGSKLPAGALLVLHEHNTALVEAAQAEAGQHPAAYPRRRRQSASLAEKQGLNPTTQRHPANSWVMLGEDLWEKGVMLGLEKLLTSTGDSTWQTGVRFNPKDRTAQQGWGVTPAANTFAHDHVQQEPHCPDQLELGQGRGRPEREEHQPQHHQPMQEKCNDQRRLQQAHSQLAHALVVQEWRGPCKEEEGGQMHTLTGRLAEAIRSIQTAAVKEQVRKHGRPGSDAIEFCVPSPRKALAVAANCTLLPGTKAVIPLPVLQRAASAHSGLEEPAAAAGTKLVVPALVGGRLQAHVREVLVMAAQALANNDLGHFDTLVSRLQCYAKKRGQGWERAAHCLLQSLILKKAGQAPNVLRWRLRFSMKEMVAARTWMFTGIPLCPFSAVCCVGALLPKLVGHSRVHLVNFGEVTVPIIPNLLKLLTQSPVEPRLQEFRFTQVSAFPLCRFDRPEYQRANAPTFLASALQKVAADAGVLVSFQAIPLRDDTLSDLDLVQRRPGEALGMCSALELKFYSEDLLDQHSISALERFKACVTRLQPDVLACVEDEVAASGNDFPSRFANWQDFLCAVYEAGDGCIGFKDVKLRHTFEDMYWRQVCRSVVGCEGRERRWRPKSAVQKDEMLLSCGLQKLPVCDKVVDRAWAMLATYPEGWALQEGYDALTLEFQGVQIARSSSWQHAELDGCRLPGVLGRMSEPSTIRNLGV